MILRSITSALRKQDWFTVAVETRIVVFGVYLGIQLGIWNAAHAERVQERDLVLRLIEDAEATGK